MDYQKLFLDKHEGKIAADIVLVMDNNGGYWMCNNPALNEEEQKEISEQYQKKYGSPKGYRDIVDILNAAGIKTEWC